MLIEKQRLTQFWSGIRATPAIFGAYALLNFLNNPGKDSFFMLLNVSNLYFLNQMAKIGFKFLYNKLGKTTLPILGLGSRPKGACNCKTFLTLPNILSTTYGMPSGHSMTAWGVVFYMILNILDEDTHYTINEKLDKTIKALSIIFLLALATVVSFSRVKVEKCHTLEQVILGAILGIMVGGMFHAIKTKSNLYDRIIEYIGYYYY